MRSQRGSNSARKALHFFPRFRRGVKSFRVMSFRVFSSSASTKKKEKRENRRKKGTFAELSPHRVDPQRQQQPLVARRAQGVDPSQLLRRLGRDKRRHRLADERQPGRGRGRGGLAQETRGEDADDEPDEEEGLCPGEEQLDVRGVEVESHFVLLYCVCLREMREGSPGR